MSFNRQLILSCALALFLFWPSLSHSLEKKSLTLISVSQTSDWEPGKIQKIEIQVQVPDQFHAYLDQIKIENIKPDGFKAGQIQGNPEVEFYDVHSKKNRKGLKGHAQISILFEAPPELTSVIREVQFDLRNQICSEQVCFLPENLPLVAKTGAISDEQPITVRAEDKSLMGRFTKALEENLPLAFLFVFLAGVLTSFTPCIFPMIPITLSVLGYDAEKHSRRQNFLRSLFYVIGIAITYSILGVIAALTGNLFGSLLSNQYVLIGMTVLFATMALGMWGAYDLQVPAFIRNRFGVSRKSEAIGETFVIGLVAGIVASPCVGPVLVSILSFVSATKNVILGFSLLFTFALGLGFLFMMIGLFSESLKLLPKSGRWMNIVKFILGAAMWSAALYYLQFAISERWWWLSVAASMIALAVWKGAFQFRKTAYLKQSFFMALFVFSSTVFLLTLFKPEYLKPLFQEAALKRTTSQIEWIPYSDEVMKQAKNDKIPVLLDFAADWCAACHELEDKTYSHPEFQELSKGFKLVKLDATQDNDRVRSILKHYGVHGLPTVIFIDRHGNELKDLTFTQFITWEKLKPKVLESLK